MQSTAPFEGPYKTKQSAIAGKKGIGYSTVRHLARMGMKKVMAKEEVESLEEISKTTLASYAKKASKDAAFKRTIGSDFDNAAKRYRKPGMQQSAAGLAMKYRSDARKREAGVEKAIDRLAKEEYVQEGNYVPTDVHINPNEKFAKEKEKAHNAAVQKAKQMAASRPVPMKTESFKSFRAALLEKTLTKAEMKKREEVAKAIERENPNMPMGMKMAIATKTAKRVAEEVISENVEQEGMHLCAKHVRSSILGDGLVLEAQHAEPDENGQIEWYMVEFKDGIHKVFTEDLEIMLAEYHGNHKKKKRMTNG